MIRPQSSPRRIVFVSYNVHACIGSDGRFMPERIAAVLEPLRADMIALQELQDRSYAGTTVSGYLAKRLRMHRYRGPSLARGTDDYGNLLLSRIGATRWRRLDISVPGREPRGAIEADFVLHGMSVRCFVTHLGLSAAERRQQVAQLLPYLERDDTDLRILAGDINEWRRYSVTLRLLRRVFGPGRSPRTFPARAPILPLDRIYVAPGWRVAETRAITGTSARRASDHLPLRSEILL